MEANTSWRGELRRRPRSPKPEIKFPSKTKNYIKNSIKQEIDLLEVVNELTTEKITHVGILKDGKIGLIEKSIADSEKISLQEHYFLILCMLYSLNLAQVVQVTCIVLTSMEIRSH